MSAINEPHPDAPADEAASFFGGDEEGPVDPGAVDAEGEPMEDDPGLVDERTEAERFEDAYQYKVEKGEPIDEAEERRHQEYVGDQEFEAAAPDEPAEVPAPPTRAEPVAADPNGATSAVEREYIVFQRVSLTKRVLEHLLKQLASGEQADPRLAYMELHREVARNDKAAVAAAYNLHREKLGESCDLAVVSSRGFKGRHVEPKPVTETTISIT